MSQPLTIGLPLNLELWAGCVIRVTALNPSDGSTAAGVNVKNIVIDVDNIGGTDLSSGAFQLVPGPGA